MIVSMMKYSFLVLQTQHEEFLNHLSNLGVVHVTINPYTPSEREQKLMVRVKELQALSNKIALLRNEYKSELDDVEKFEGSIEQYESRFATLYEEYEHSKIQRTTLRDNLSQALPWGDFSIEDIDRLRQNGITFRYFSTSEKNFSEQLQQEYTIEEISRSGGVVYFILVSQQGDENISDITSCREITAPTVGHIFIADVLEKENIICSGLHTNIASMVATSEIINHEIDRIKGELEYDAIKNSNHKVAEDSIVVIEGWAPKDKCAELDPIFESMPTTIWFKDKPTIDEEPPVLLKNGSFSRSAEVITKLYALPKYNEVDMTPFFAPFFIMFVGICLGDSGYGALLILGGIYAKIKFKKPDMQGVINLILYCGISTVLIGFITGVFFGENLAEWRSLAPIKSLFIPSSDMFGIALAIGVIQILYAIVLRSIIRMRRYGILYGFAGLGWVAVIISSICAIALPKAGIETSYTTDSLAYYITIGIAGVMMLFFQDPKKSILFNFGLGLWGLYNNITGLLGDVLSYVRLFALGLSGGVIAGVFNKLAESMSGDIPGLNILIMIVIMVIGHSINFFISAIGSFVHPIRLTFVEFYKNVGFEGGGMAYNPFKNKTKIK